MDRQRVYFSDLRASAGNSLPRKLERLIRTAGIGSIDFANKLTAIKLHFGEPGNLSYLRPTMQRQWPTW